jgi:hypothetical protein
MATLVERRRPAVDAELLRRVTLAFLLVVVLLFATNIAAIAGTRFPDPDDTLRLVQVRDLVAGQNWFDLNQHRVDAAGGGVPMHWSRLVDIPLAAVILAFTPLVGQANAEMIALIGIPVLTFGIAIFLAGRIAWRLLNEEATTFACLAMALSVPVVAQLRPLRIDHHGWQIVLALAAVNGLMARSPRAGGWVVGLALAAWLSISVEGLPLAVAFVAICALRWLRREEDKAWLVSTMQALALGSIVLFAATRGIGNLATYCDAISPIHLAIFAWGAVALTGLAALGRHPWPFTLTGFAVTGAGAAGIVALGAPQCAGGSFVALDPLVREYWYLGVGEGLPVWEQPLDVMLQVVLPPLIGLWAATHLARTTGDWLQRFWIDYALLLAAALLVACFVSRAGAVTGALAAVPLGWQIREWIHSARKMASSSRRALALAGVAMVLVPATPVTLFTMAMPAKAEAVSANTTRASTCRIPEASEVLRSLPQGEILAPLDIGPRLVYETQHSVIATGHHRGSTAMRTVIEAFLGTESKAHTLVTRRGSSYVAICPDLGEPALYMENAPDGFAAQLVTGEAPDWLEPVAMPDGVGFRIWKVKS